MKLIKTNHIDVKIYENKAAMRRAIRRIGFKADYTEAMVIPVEAYSFKNGKEEKLPTCAEMYLHKNVSMPVLVHETLHAATVTIRKNGKSLDLGLAIRRNEERLAYTQTDILQTVLKHFFPKKNSDYNLSDIEWWAKNSVKESRK